VTADVDPTVAADITVLIADDEPLVRSGLRAIIDSEPGLRVVAEAADGAQAVALARSLRPDVICMDVRMPTLDGLRATELVLRLDQPPRVLVVTTFASDDYVLEAMRAGAAGFLLKRATADELIHAVRTVASSEHLLYPAAIRDLVLRLGRPDTYRGEPLTARELEVLQLVAEGLGNSGIAERLVIGLETVRTHVAAVLRKLHARDRTHAVVLALGTGLIQLPSDLG
jgi:DNA-binding NarL/FixJ family response regulator